MRKVIVLVCLFTICYGYSQTTTEYFNIEKYKDWEIDSEYSPAENREYLKKGNERIKISFRENTIQVEETNTRSAYGRTIVYYPKSNLLKSVLYKFYVTSIKVFKLYDETGKLLKEINYDEPYKITLQEVIEKVKKEYEVDLEDKLDFGVLSRFENDEPKKPFYEVYLRTKENKSKFDYLLIDATTGETLYKTFRYFPVDSRDMVMSPFDEYLESVKKTEQENKSYYKTYEGKDYTKEEWEAFEEKWYEDYKKKKNSKGFWDDIFKRP